MPRIFVLSILLALSSFALAQNPRPRITKPDPAAEKAALETQLSRKTVALAATSACSYTFTTGTGQTYLQTCVTVNGNIVEFQTPSGVEHVRVGAYGEGYGICDITNSANTGYYDYADYGDTGNWLDPVTLSSTATSVKIQRKTVDGIWTLTQTITQNSAQANVKITMALKNNTAIKRYVYVNRWVDIDADGGIYNNFDSTYEGVVGDVSSQYGMSAQSVAPWTYLWGAFVTSTFPNLDPCDYYGSSLVSSPQSSFDGGAAIAYFTSSGIGPGASKSFSQIYSGR